MTAMQGVLPEKTLFDVLREIWRAKLYMIICMLITLALAVVFLSLATPFYRAEMILAPASPMGHGMAVSALIGEGTAQVQPDDLQSSAAFLRFEHVYNGATVAAALLKDDKILQALQMDQKFVFSKPETDWTAEKLAEYLKKRVKLEPVSGTILRKITYYHPDKKLAAALIMRVHHVADTIIRSRVLLEVQGRVAYLNEALSRASNPEHKRSLTALLMEQERLKMMVSLDQPYAATVVEPPSVSSRPRWPDHYVLYSVFIMVGLFLGFVVHGVRHHE